MEFRSKKDGSHYPLGGRGTDKTAFNNLKSQNNARKAIMRGESLIQPAQVKKALEYSHEKSKLEELLKHIDVRIDLLKYDTYFDDDTQPRNIYKVYLRRKDRKGSSVSFTFGDSISNTEQGNKPDLYSILSSIGVDYFAPDTFDDFVSEFGYDPDSRKVERLFKRVQEQQKKLKRVLDEDEARAMPG